MKSEAGAARKIAVPTISSGAPILRMGLPSPCCLRYCSTVTLASAARFSKDGDHHGRGCDVRAQGVYGNAERSEFGGQLLGQHVDGALRGAVAGITRALRGDLAADGREVHDLAVAVLLEVAAKVLGGDHEAGDIGVQHLTERVDIEIEGVLLLVEALGIDEDGDLAAELFLGVLHESGNLRFVRRVGCEITDRDARSRLDLLLSLFQGILLAAGDEDLGASLDEALRDGLPRVRLRRRRRQRFCR